jgi:hypothetical protein
MANEDMWDKLLKRVDSIRIEFEPTQARAESALKLAIYVLMFSFLHEALDHPTGARKLKDAIVRSLREAGLSNILTETLREFVVDVCDKAEELQ